MKTEMLKRLIDRGITVDEILDAVEMGNEGNGCNTVGFLLNKHWKTASAMMLHGNLLPRIK